MRKLYLFLLTAILATSVFAKSPHGESFKIECATCHVTDNWTRIKTDAFNHDKTKFPLVGQHKSVACRKCHQSLEFSKAKTNCSACHLDIHQQTVGQDCERCHTPKTWIISNVKQIHQQIGFPLVGSHASADCNRCHTSASQLRFDNLRTDCYACHKVKYEATNHRTVGFGTDCFNCHNMTGREWSISGKGFEHGLFPITGAHNIECSSCHFNNNYSIKISPDCKTCHSTAYSRANTIVAGHTSKMTKFSCTDCHNTQSWNTVRFTQHDSWFGIYSGKHRGKWDKCTDCHSNDANYKSNCKRCHD